MRQRWLGLDATVGGFIYSKSAGEPLKDSAQSSQLMELLFLKTQWLMCGEQVNRHRSRKVSGGFQPWRRKSGGVSNRYRASGMQGDLEVCYATSCLQLTVPRAHLSL